MTRVTKRISMARYQGQRIWTHEAYRGSWIGQRHRSGIMFFHVARPSFRNFVISWQAAAQALTRTTAMRWCAIFKSRAGHAVRPPRYAASTSTCEETGRMRGLRSMNPSTTRDRSLRSIPMSRSMRSSIRRSASISFRRCQRRKVVRSQCRTAWDVRFRCLAVRWDGKGSV